MTLLPKQHSGSALQTSVLRMVLQFSVHTDYRTDSRAALHALPPVGKFLKLPLWAVVGKRDGALVCQMKRELTLEFTSFSLSSMDHGPGSHPAVRLRWAGQESRFKELLQVMLDGPFSVSEST